MNQAKNVKKLGLWMAMALVIGNMIGSGIFFLPSSLGAYGGISILGWLFTSAGALILAFIFSRLSQIVRNVSGGPYAYTRDRFGDFPGFLVAWGYILSVWGSNAAITVAFVSYLSVFFPVLGTNPLAGAGTGILAITFLTWLNTRPVRNAGKFQVITTSLKLMPLLLMAFVGIFYLNPEHFHPFNTSTSSHFEAISHTAALTLFAFLGFECATIPAEKIANADRIIPRATIWGTLITITVYLLGTVAVMGIISPMELTQSNAPFADAAARIWGSPGRYLVAGGVVVSTFGALNGWILIQGQIPYAAARDQLFPPLFKRTNRYDMPVTAILIGSAIITVAMLMNYSRGLVKAFEFLILVTTTTVLLSYLFGAAAYALFILQGRNKLPGSSFKSLILPILGFAYALWAVSGTGMEPVYWGFLLLFAGIPFYVYIRFKASSSNE
ncbi:MAG: amino acid permease [Saprospiraceae bacterium]